MSRNARRENKTRSIQTSVQVLLVVVGVGLLVTGLALAASGTSVDEAVDSISDEWGDQGSTETGSETQTSADGGDGSGGAGDDEAADDSQDGDGGDGTDESDGASDDGSSGDSETDAGDESDDGEDNETGAGNESDDGTGNESETGTDDETTESDETHALTVLVEDEDGEPLENATVAVDSTTDFSSGNETATDDDGEAAFNLTDGEYEITASADGYEDAEDTVEIDGDDEEITLTLETSDEATDGTGNDNNDDGEQYRTLTAFVVDEDGEPLEDATVEIQEPGLFGDSDDGETGDDGKVEFAVQDGEYEVTAAADGYDEAETTVEIDGDDEEVLLRLEESAFQ